MRRLLPLIALLATSCQLALPDAALKKPATPSAKASGEAPAVAPSATMQPRSGDAGLPPGGTAATAQPTPAAARPSAAPALLARPAGNVKTVVGRVLVDASYMVSSGAGSVTSHNGSAIVAAGGPGMIAAGAGNMIAAGAGNMIAAGAGNLVAAGAGNLVAAGAGNLVAAGAGNYQLAQATAAPAGAGPAAATPVGSGSAAPASAAPPSPPAQGAQLPAAGMEVRARSLRTGEALPLGVGPAGEPVYVVYTNAEGAYEVYLPETESGNVLMEVRAPGKPADARLRYDMVSDTRKAAPAEEAGKAGYGRVIDEDTTLVTRYVQSCLVPRMVDVFTTKDQAGLIDRTIHEWQVPPSVSGAIVAFVGEYRRAADEAGLSGQSAETVRPIARRCMEVTLSQIALDEVMITPATIAEWGQHPDAPAIATMIGVLRESRESLAARMANDPAFMKTWPFGAGFHGADYLPVRASDPADFMVETYLTSNDPEAFIKAGQVLAWAGVDGPGVSKNPDGFTRLSAASVAILMEIARVAMLDAAVHDANLALIQGWRESKPAAGQP